MAETQPLFTTGPRQSEVHRKLSDVILPLTDATKTCHDWNQAYPLSKPSNTLTPNPMGSRQPRKRCIIIVSSDYSETGWNSLGTFDLRLALGTAIGLGLSWEVLADSLAGTEALLRPTKKHIQTYLQAMVKNTRTGDEYVLFWSGHGSEDGIFTIDGQWITVDELNSWLVTPLVAGSSLLAFFDSCFSVNPLGQSFRHVLKGGRLVAESTGRHNPTEGSVLCVGAAKEAARQLSVCDDLKVGALTLATFFFIEYAPPTSQGSLEAFRHWCDDVFSGEQELQLSGTSKDITRQLTAKDGALRLFLKLTTKA